MDPIFSLVFALITQAYDRLASEAVPRYDLSVFSTRSRRAFVKPCSRVEDYNVLSAKK